MAGRASFSSSSSFSYGWNYDVFLSFRGPDTRYGFTGNLYKALHDKGIHTFFDEDGLPRGDEITPSLLKAIEESMIAIPIFSQNYAASSSCLDELVHIIDCKKAKGRLVLPVFYDVEPSVVRYKVDSYGEALAKHVERFFKCDKENLNDNMERLEKWKMALEEAADLSGEHFKLRNEKYEHEFIGTIVEVVSNKINRAPLQVADYPVGLESRVLEVNSLLDVGSDDVVHMVGIHGIGGIGKTTLARAVYNSIADSFEGICFLGSVRENSMKHGLVHLQEMLLSKIVGEKDIKLGDVCEGISIIKHRLQGMKVLLILDDVDKLEQLQAMVGGPDWFGPGSRIIITTRDKHLLASHGVERTHELDGLNMREAIELLNWKAFRTNKVDPSYIHILNRVVTYASGLPLALEVIGSNLFGKSVEECESALDQYKRVPNKEIQKILKVSFDALEEDVQKIFLDIACFFNENKLAEVEGILCAHYGVCVKYGIGVLVEKSLIKIDYGRVTLHDLIRDMGREIVRQESPEKPEKRSRLWLPEDIVQVLEGYTGTCETQIIILDFPKSKEEEVKLDGQAFKEMKSLKTLIIRNGRFSHRPKHLPNSLRVLEWWGYPSQSLPFDFHPKKLVIFKLPHSRLMSLNLLERKKFENLTILNVSSNDCITQIPDVSGIPNLVELSFSYCNNLIKIHKSVGFLDKLRTLNANGCEKLRTFPPINLTSLKELNLSCCLSLENFPEILGKMENITKLIICYTAIKELPFSIRNLTQLQNIELRHHGMVQLPSSIVMLPKLRSFCVWECEGLQLSKQDEGIEQVSSRMSSNMFYVGLFSCNIPDEFLANVLLTCFANVETITLNDSNFTVLPACIKECHFLRELNLDFCVNLREIGGLPPNIKTLTARNCSSLTSSSRSMLGNEKLHRKGGDKMFIFPGTRIPNWFEHYSSGEPISFWFRNKFPVISLCLATESLMFSQAGVRPKLFINGIDKGDTFNFSELSGNDILIFDKKQIKFEDVDEVLLENEWNHVVVSYGIIGGEYLMEPTVQQIGVHIFKQKCSMEDIRFTDPWEKVIKHVDTMVSHIQFMPLQQNLALLEPHVEQGREWLSLLPPPAMKSLNNNVNCNPNSMASTRISSSISVQDTFHEVKRKRNRRKENLNNRESVESCWRPGTQGRGLRGGRGNFSPHNVSQDAGSSKNPGTGKDNGAHQVTEKVALPLPASQETISKDKSSGTSSAANGPTSVASGTTSGVSPSPSSSGSGDRMDPSSGANNNLGSALPSASSNKGAKVASGSGSMPSSSNCSGSVPASSSPVNFSSSDPVLVPSNDLWFPGSIGAIRREVGSQHPPGESNAVNSAENKLTAASKTGSSSVQGKIQGKSQGVAKNHFTEMSPTSSTITHGSSSASRPSSNYGSRSQQLTGPQKAGSNKEWKPNSTNTVNQGSGPAFASAPSVSAEVTGQLQSASSALDSEEAISKLQKKLEDFHLPQRQHVILPNHIYVPDSEKNKFSFGSLGVTFGVNKSYVSGPESEKSSTPLSETSQTIEETVEEQASSSQNATVTSEVGDYPDHPQSPTNEPENLSSSEVDGSSSAIQEYNESKQDTTLPSGGHQYSGLHASPNYSFGFVPPMLGTQLTPFDNSESQTRDISRLPNFVVHQPFDPASYYAQFYRSGADSDGRLSPFPSAGVTTKYNGNVTVLSAPNSQSPQEGGVLSTAGPTPLVTQATGLMQSSIAVTQQPVPVFRPPSGVHISHYPPNYIPYGHYFSPFYVPPPAIHQFLGNGAFPQQPQASTVYPPPSAVAATGMKYPLPQFKPGANAANPTHLVMPSAYGAYGSSPAGYNHSSAATAGNSTSNEDLGSSQFKESNLYISGQQSEGSAVWVAAPGRDISSLPTSSFYNLPPQGQHVTFAPTQPGHGTFAGIYHPAQAVTAATVHPLLQQSQTMAGAVDMGGPGGNVYQQPQHAQINWPSNY